MFLKYLYDYYEQNLKDKFPMGSDYKPVNFVIVIDYNGKYCYLTSIEDEKGHPVKRLLPYCDKATSGSSPKLFYGTSDYLLKDYSSNKSKKDTEERFTAFVQKCTKAAQETNDPQLLAVCKFYENEEYKKVEYTSEIKGKTITFQILGEDKLVSENLKLYEYAINTELEISDKEEICCITGKKCHPILKTVVDAGRVSFVTFHENDGYDSYVPNQQALNSPMSREANYAYSCAFRYLSNTTTNHFRLGDAEYIFGILNNGDENENDFTSLYCHMFFNPSNEEIVKEYCKSVFGGKNSFLTSNDKMFIIGYVVNNGRIEVVYEKEMTVAEFATNINKHFNYAKYTDENNEIAIAKGFGVYGIFTESLKKNQKKDDEIKSHHFLLNNLIKTIIEGRTYNESIVRDYILRIENPSKKEKQPLHNLVRISYFKAWLNRNKNINIDNMATSTNSPAYFFGRYFAAIVNTQFLALGFDCKKNKSYLDTPAHKTYARKALSTPLAIIEPLRNSANYYLRKNGNKVGWLLKTIDKLERKSLPELPKRMSIEDQVSFILGFNEQWEDFFKKNQEKTLVA